jgi:lysophospholipase L1-like esterase
VTAARTDSGSLLLPPADGRLGFFAPQAVDRGRSEARLDRFPSAAAEPLAGQIGPLANLRSSSGCALWLLCDAPWVELRLERLRHHQPGPQGLACEVRQEDGSWLAFSSRDLREADGAVAVRFATGLERGGPQREIALWLPPISTCAVAGVALPAGTACAAPQPPAPRWLAIGDSLTQGFSVQCPSQTWVHRCMRQWDLPAWNLGVGGMRIEPEVVRWALDARRWDLVTIALGSNHSWRDADAAVAAERAVRMAELALAGGHGRVAWLLPPYKPCEEGKGPPEFAGVPLDAAAGERVGRVREALRLALAPFAPRLELIADLAPRDHRLYADGLHPTALGSARYAQNLQRALALG